MDDATGCVSPWGVLIVSGRAHGWYFFARGFRVERGARGEAARRGR
jgi:hypothetical protein